MSNQEFPHRKLPHAMRRVGLLFLAVGIAIGVCYWRTPPRPDQLFQRGVQLTDQDPAVGERWIRQAIDAAAGDYPEAQMALAELLGSQGRWEEANSVFSGIHKSGCRSDQLLKFGRQAIESDYDQLGLESLNLVRSRSTPEAVQALELLASYYREFSQMDELEVVIRELANRQSNNPQRWLDLAVHLKKTYQETECLVAVRTALDHYPPPELRRHLESMLLDQLVVVGDASGAWATFEKMQRDQGDSTQLLAKKIDLYRMTGQMEKALETIESIFPQIEHMPVAFMTRGAIYLDLGRFQKAVDDLSRVVVVDPYNEGAHFKLSEAYRGIQDVERSRRHRELGMDLRQKRIRMIALITEFRSKPHDTQLMKEFARLSRELGQRGDAKDWDQRASPAV